MPMPVEVKPAFLKAPGHDEMQSPRLVRKESLKFQIFVVSGRRPERKEFRLGEHTPCWT